MKDFIKGYDARIAGEPLPRDCSKRFFDGWMVADQDNSVMED